MTKYEELVKARNETIDKMNKGGLTRKEQDNLDMNLVGIEDMMDKIESRGRDIAQEMGV